MKLLEKNTARNLREFAGYMSGHKKWAVVGGICLSLSVAMNLPLPLITRFILDDILPGGLENAPLLGWIVSGLIILVLVHMVVGYFESCAFSIFREKVISDLKMDLFSHVMRVKLREHRKLSTGYLASRIEGDCSRLSGIMAGTVFTFIKEILVFFVGVGMLFYIHWKMALIAMILLPPFAASMHLFSTGIKRHSIDSQEREGIYRGVLQEMLNNLQVIKAYMLERYCSERVSASLDRSVRSNIELERLSCFASSAAGIISTAAPLVILWFAGREIMAGRLTVGSWIAFNTFLGYLFGPVSSMLNINLAVQRSLGALDRVMEIKAFPIEKRITDGRDTSISDFTLGLEGISFSYGNGEKVLEDIDVEFKTGETVMIAGPSGCGKSTLINLILGLDTPMSGRITIGGVDISTLGSVKLRGLIGAVFQEPFIFSGTVSDNITLGAEDPGEYKMRAASSLAGLDNFVLGLQNGYKTLLGERGVNLSGGEKQKLAIARMFFIDPPVLILDESTSQLDSISERIIMRNLALARKGRTTVIIAHRLSSIVNADKVVVLNKGRINSSGSHVELRRTNRMYTSLQKPLRSS